MTNIPILSRAVSLVALRRKAGAAEVLLLKRVGALAGTWCQIAGKIEPGETPPQTALRELHEETGLRPLEFYSGDICEQFYEASANAIFVVPVFLAWIASDAPVRLNDEHSDHRWLSFDAACDLVSFGGQRRVLRWIEAEFVARAPSEHLRLALP